MSQEDRLVAFQTVVGQWAEKTFPKSTNHSIVHHLIKEVQELHDHSSKEELAVEAADCYLLLLHLAHKNKFSLYKEAEHKMVVNQMRTWGTPDKDGVVEHVRESSAETAAAKADTFVEGVFSAAKGWPKKLALWFFRMIGGAVLLKHVWSCGYRAAQGNTKNKQGSETLRVLHDLDHLTHPIVLRSSTGHINLTYQEARSLVTDLPPFVNHVECLRSNFIRIARSMRNNG